MLSGSVRIKIVPYDKNIDCGYSLGPPRCFRAGIRKIMYTPVNLKWGLSGSKLYRHVFVMVLKILSPDGKFQINKSDIFHISAQNIDCGYSSEPRRRGGSNEYSQSLFLSRNK